MLRDLGCGRASCAVRAAVSTTTVSGALKPGPKPVGEQVVRLALGGVRRGRAVVGQAEAQVQRGDRDDAEADDRDQQHGDRAAGDARAQRAPKLGWRSPALRRRGSRRPRMRPPMMRRPAKPSSAGSRVSAMSTATATVTAAARPIWVRNGMPTTDSAASAMTTVRPAKTTADPAVPTARPAASSGSRPAASSCR